jgi:hypothetical protein
MPPPPEYSRSLLRSRLSSSLQKTLLTVVRGTTPNWSVRCNAAHKRSLTLSSWLRTITSRFVPVGQSPGLRRSADFISPASSCFEFNSKHCRTVAGARSHSTTRR